MRYSVEFVKHNFQVQCGVCQAHTFMYSVEFVTHTPGGCVNTGSAQKLVFGAGTRLSVQPNLRNSPPSVYRLKPAAGSENQTGPACLITDFFPSDQVKVFINNKEGQRPPTLVESGKRWSYGVVEWSSDPHGQPVNCAASYKARHNYTYEDDVQKSCPVMSVDESFQTDEKLNTLSLTVLGLKIIFMKSIAFNILMTRKLWTHLRNSPPSVYRLKPAAGSENQTGPACLITDFFPSDQVKVFINNKEGQRPPTLVESGKRWSYGVVEWSSDPHGQPVNCAASYKARHNYTYEDDVQKSCPVMSVDESFQTDEKLNTLSLTVLGLKIIFMKSIAFNILMTLKLWTR
ncbi:uncharacterized protein LOC144825364 [Lissotriton helveticus]